MRVVVLVLAAVSSAVSAARRPVPALVPHDDLPPTLVTTTLGAVQGRAGDGCAEFLGIPYAEAPVGNLRFRPAQPVQAWAPSVLDATRTRTVCTQPPFYFDDSGEDCLFLNIFTPQGAGKDNLLPVALYIHGGGFHDGAGSVYNGTKLAHQGLVVVTINYRLGALGQLASEDIRDEQPFVKTLGGMNFLSDQLTALQWVRDQIAAFGGDKDQITLFGESAGSLSVCMLAASPVAQGKFQNLILQSGSCVERWGPVSTEVGLQTSRRFMDEVGAKTIGELRGFTTAEIIRAQEVVDVFPSVDGYFLPEHPNVTYAAGRTSLPPNGRAMVGATTMDGLMPEPWFSYGQDLPKTEAEYRDKLVKYFGNLTKLPDGTSVVDATMALYPATPNATQSYVQINSDICVVCPTRRIALELALAERETFAYMFGFNPRNHGLASHASDVSMVFGYPDPLVPFFPFDEARSLPLREAWASFAKGGAVLAGDVELPLFGVGEQNYLNASSSADAVLRGFKPDRCDLWDEVGRGGWDHGGSALMEFCIQQPAD